MNKVECALNIATVAFLLVPLPVQAIEYVYAKTEKVKEILYCAGFKGHEEAMRLYQEALELEPDCANIYDRRALELESQGKYEEALQDSSKAVNLAPEYPSFSILKARILFHLGRYEEAMDALEIVFKTEKRVYGREYCRIYGACLYHQGKYKESLSALGSNSHHQGGGPSINCYYYMGMCELKLGRPEKALEYLNVAITLRPQDARKEFFLARAEVYDNLGKKELATEDRKKAETMKYRHWSSF